MRQHRFFSDVNWDKVKRRKQEPVPYIPDANKNRHVLLNNYETINVGGSGGNGSSQKPDIKNKSDSPKKSHFLGELSIYKINKEFENF
jgi:hypothetical protein